MANLLATVAKAASFTAFPPPNNALIALRTWVAARGGPAHNDFGNLAAWVYAYAGEPVPPDSGGGGGGGGD